VYRSNKDAVKLAPHRLMHYDLSLPVCILLLWQALEQSIQILAGFPEEDFKDMTQVHLTRRPSKGQIIVHLLPDSAGSSASGPHLDRSSSSSKVISAMGAFTSANQIDKCIWSLKWSTGSQVFLGHDINFPRTCDPSQIHLQ